jgi:hypothetical protein
METQPLKNKITEDKTFVINMPYNAGKEIFNTELFKIRIFKENGDDYAFVIIRRREKEETLTP